MGHRLVEIRIFLKNLLRLADGGDDQAYCGATDSLEKNINKTFLKNLV